VAHAPGSAGGEGGDGRIGKVLPQRAELAVLGAKLVAPFGDAVGFVDGEKGQRNALQPADGVGPRQPFRGEIQEPEGPLLPPSLGG